jgi:hypothetical protein
MTIPLFRKMDGKKFMWDGAAYDTQEEAGQVMEGYAKDGFEVRQFENEGRFLVYSRRVAEVQSAD